MSEDAAPSSGARLPRPDSGFLQGFVEAWDAIAGTNAVRVRGRTCNNLLSLLGPETGLIRPNDTVIVGRYHNTYAVFGRVEPLGEEQRAFGVHFADTITLNDTAAPGTWEPRNGPSVSVYIGSTRRCMVSLSAEMLVENNVERVGVQISGASSISPVEWRALTIGSPELEFQGSRTLVFTAADGLNEGTNVFQTMHKTSAAAPLPLVGEVQIIVQPF